MVTYCQRCVMPDTRPGEWKTLAEPFDKDGVCVACRNYEKRKTINWDARWKLLEDTCNKYRKSDGNYDCVIPVSGGKDSTFLVYTMREVLGMNPLLVNVSDPFTHTKAGEANLHNVSDTFNCDVVQFRISEDLFRRAARSNFEEFLEPLILVEAAIYTIPLAMAMRYKIPFLVQGEDPNYEYGSTEKDSPTLNRHYEKILNAAGLDFWTKRGFSERELNCLVLPNDTLGDTHAIPMSYYVPWNDYEHMELAKRWGFRDLAHEWKREYAFEDFNQIDSQGWVVDLWCKWPKFGYARATDIACRWIRESRITRDEALRITKEKDPILDEVAFRDFLDFTGYSVREFWSTVEKFWNPMLFEKKNGIWKLRCNDGSLE